MVQCVVWFKLKIAKDQEGYKRALNFIGHKKLLLKERTPSGFICTLIELQDHHNNNNTGLTYCLYLHVPAQAHAGTAEFILI